MKFPIVEFPIETVVIAVIITNSPIADPLVVIKQIFHGRVIIMLPVVAVITIVKTVANLKVLVVIRIQVGFELLS